MRSRLMWVLAVTGALVLGTGCQSWHRISLERGDILHAHLHQKEVRFETAEGVHAMIVTEVGLPPPERGLAGAYLRGEHEEKPVRVYLEGVYFLEVRERYFWETEGFNNFALVSSVAVSLAILIAATCWLTDQTVY